jgi:hypothetical protein
MAPTVAYSLAAYRVCAGRRNLGRAVSRWKITALGELATMRAAPSDERPKAYLLPVSSSSSNRWSFADGREALSCGARGCGVG